MALCDIDKLAADLDVSKDTLYRMAKERLIPFFRIRGQLRFDLAQVQSVLQLPGRIGAAK